MKTPVQVRMTICNGCSAALPYDQAQTRVSPRARHSSWSGRPAMGTFCPTCAAALDARWWGSHIGSLEQPRDDLEVLGDVVRAVKERKD